MLPYGTYVVVEQQPKYAWLKDWKNRHYETDRPKEIKLPAVYADEAGARSPRVFWIRSTGIRLPFRRRSWSSGIRSASWKNPVCFRLTVTGEILKSFRMV